MKTTVVERLHNEFNDLLQLLEKTDEISLKSMAEDNFRKVLLLASASYFERVVTDDVISFVDEISSSNPLIVSFLKNKAIKRQYHTWFNWEDKNANQFYGLFGSEYFDFMKNKIKNSSDLENAVRSFLELGRERNRLVHQDFATFSLEKTSLEIFSLFQKATFFVEYIPLSFKEFLASQSEI